MGGCGGDSERHLNRWNSLSLPWHIYPNKLSSREFKKAHGRRAVDSVNVGDFSLAVLPPFETEGQFRFAVHWRQVWK